MKVLVTGCDGYIGLPLTQLLHQAGHQVIGLDTGYFRAGWWYHGASWLCPIISKDIRQVTAADLVDCAAVIHLAEISNDPMGQTDPAVTNSINHLGTKALVAAAKAAGVARFVYFSSCSVYGESPDTSDEHSPVNPLTAYAKCKVLNERHLLQEQSDAFAPVILRNATAFGASPRMRFDLVVNNLSGLAWTQQEIRMESDGTPWRPFVHVRDISAAALCAMQAPVAVVAGQIFNVGHNSQNYQIKSVAEIVAAAFPGCLTKFGDRGGDKRDYRVNFDKITSQLPGFRCQYSVADGARELRQLFELVQLDQPMLTSRHFTRLQQLQYLRQTKQIDADFYWQLPNVSPTMALAATEGVSG